MTLDLDLQSIYGPLHSLHICEVNLLMQFVGSARHRDVWAGIFLH